MKRAARNRVKRDIAEAREKARLARHELRFGIARVVADVNQAERTVTIGFTRNEYQKQKAHEREQRYYRRKRHQAMRSDHRVADGGLFALLSRVKGGLPKRNEEPRKTPYWYRDGRRVTA